MSILEKLGDKYYWQQLLKSKKDGGHLSAREEKLFVDFINEERYAPIVKDILDGKPFPLPTVKSLNKKNAKKKRTVFVFEESCNMVLKLLAFLLNSYDHLFYNNLYSFRHNVCVKNALSSILKATKGGSSYTYKVDVSDYFNSVSPEKISALIDKYLCDDLPVAGFIKSLILQPYCIKDGKAVCINKGIMAGVPISGFLANLYLMELDALFFNKGVTYARYSDDIIVFAKTLGEIEEYKQVIDEHLAQKGLAINPKKEVLTAPGEPWEFLGFSVKDGKVDISTIALEKIKDKMRRKAKALVRWKKRNNKSSERAICAFIRHFNRKFYNNPDLNDITWCRWYFPTISSSDSLHVIDEYMLSCIRYIETGKHTKANFNLRYETIKGFGYKSLVNEFYKCKKQ